MTQSEKKLKLERLDALVLDKMLEILEGGRDLDELRELATPINMLRNNSVLSEKPKSSVEKDTKKRLADAKARRDAKESK